MPDEPTPNTTPAPTPDGPLLPYPGRDEKRDSIPFERPPAEPDRRTGPTFSR